MATGGRYPGQRQGNATSGDTCGKSSDSQTAVWYKIPIIQAGESTRTRFDQKTSELLEAAYQLKKMDVSFVDRATQSSFTAYLDRKELYQHGIYTLHAHLERVCEEREPDKTRNTAVGRGQSPQTSNVKKPNDTKERQMMVEQYKDKASKFVAMLKDVTDWMKEFPANLEDMKEELAEIGRIRNEDILKQIVRKTEILKMYEDVQTDGGKPMIIDENLGPGSIKELCIRFDSEMNNREARLSAEIARLESLESQVKKFHEDTKQLDGRLDNIEHRIGDVKTHRGTADSLQARQESDALERELQDIEDRVKILLRDVETILKGGHSNTDQLVKRLLGLQRKASQIRTLMFRSISQKPSQPSVNVMLTAQHQKASNGAQMVERNPVFQHVQDCLQWIDTKQEALEVAWYGSDKNLIKQALDHHVQEHQSILDYKKEVDLCIKETEKLYKKEQEQCIEWISKVQVAYRKLLDSSLQRQQSLQSLLDFIQAAEQELDWLKEKIEQICNCSSDLLNMPCEQIYQDVSIGMTNREAHFISVQEYGLSLVFQTHPAKVTMEAFTLDMKSHWIWLLQFLECLNTHNIHMSNFMKFFEEAERCEVWMSKVQEYINEQTRLQNLPLEELQKIKKECHDLQIDLVRCDEAVMSLCKRSCSIIPFNERLQCVTFQNRVLCLCDYEQPAMSLQRGEECIVLENSQKVRWKVRNSRGEEDTVLSICLLILPPNPEAVDCALRLRMQLDELKTLLKNVTQNIELSQIQFLKTLDVKQTMTEKKSEYPKSVSWYAIDRKGGERSKLPEELCQWLESAYLQGKSPTSFRCRKTGSKYTACLGKENRLFVDYKPSVKLERVVEDRIVQLKGEEDRTKIGISYSAQLQHTPDENENHPNTMSLGPARCKILLRDLNDGAATLVAETGEDDQKMQLQKDLDDCYWKVQEISKKLSEEVLHCPWEKFEVRFEIDSAKDHFSSTDYAIKEVSPVQMQYIAADGGERDSLMDKLRNKHLRGMLQSGLLRIWLQDGRDIRKLKENPNFISELKNKVITVLRYHIETHPAIQEKQLSQVVVEDVQEAQNLRHLECLRASRIQIYICKSGKGVSIVGREVDKYIESICRALEERRKNDGVCSISGSVEFKRENETNGEVLTGESLKQFEKTAEKASVEYSESGKHLKLDKFTVQLLIDSDFQGELCKKIPGVAVVLLSSEVIFKGPPEALIKAECYLQGHLKSKGYWHEVEQAASLIEISKRLNFEAYLKRKCPEVCIIFTDRKVIFIGKENMIKASEGELARFHNAFSRHCIEYKSFILNYLKFQDVQNYIWEKFESRHIECYWQITESGIAFYCRNDEQYSAAKSALDECIAAQKLSFESDSDLQEFEDCPDVRNLIDQNKRRLHKEVLQAGYVIYVGMPEVIAQIKDLHGRHMVDQKNQLQVHSSQVLLSHSLLAYVRKYLMENIREKFDVSLLELDDLSGIKISGAEDNVKNAVSEVQKIVDQTQISIDSLECPKVTNTLVRSRQAKETVATVEEENKTFVEIVSIPTKGKDTLRVSIHKALDVCLVYGSTPEREVEMQLIPVNDSLFPVCLAAINIMKKETDMPEKAARALQKYLDQNGKKPEAFRFIPDDVGGNSQHIVYFVMPDFPNIMVNFQKQFQHGLYAVFDYASKTNVASLSLPVEMHERFPVRQISTIIMETLNIYLDKVEQQVRMKAIFLCLVEKVNQSILKQVLELKIPGEASIGEFIMEDYFDHDVFSKDFNVSVIWKQLSTQTVGTYIRITGASYTSVRTSYDTIQKRLKELGTKEGKDACKVPNEDTESKIPQKCQDEEVDGTLALTRKKTDVPGWCSSKINLSEVDQEDSMVYMEFKTEIAEDVLNNIKITYGQQGIDSLISDLDEFAKVETCEGRVLVLCDYKHAENVQRCVKSHCNKANKERKSTEENKHFIYGGNDNLKEWLQFAYGHTSWSKNLQLEGGKLYLLGSVQMKKEVEKAVHSMNYWYQEEFMLSTEEQQKADEVAALVKNELPAIFIKQTKETIAVLSDNKDNFEWAKHKVKVALGRIKITARGRGCRDPQAYGESFSVMSKDDKMDVSPKFPTSGFHSNQPTAFITPKSYYIKEGLTAKVYLGNITSLLVDCIVNAANGLLSHGGGVALAISKAAGREFDQEGEVYVRKHGPIPVTHCCVTSAGRLPYKVVIHAVGPQWSDYKNNEKERCGDDLKKAIVNCLIEADKIKMASIAIPPLSSGIFGVPKQLCAQMYAKGVVEYSKTCGLQSVKEIHFVDTISEMCQLTQLAFDEELQCY